MPEYDNLIPRAKPGRGDQYKEPPAHAEAANDT